MMVLLPRGREDKQFAAEPHHNDSSTSIMKSSTLFTLFILVEAALNSSDHVAEAKKFVSTLLCAHHQ
jgi:hypothetical protein